MLLRLARNWLRIALLLLALYSGLPWLAPTLAKLGFDGPADFLYTLYSPFCHQFAFRSPFLFGEQAFYPRRAAGSGYQPFEVYASESEAFLEQYRFWSSAFGSRAPAPPGTIDGLSEFSVAQQLAARHFIGDESLGYKTSLCARDLAIYTMLFAGGLVYRRYRWRIRPLPLWLFVLGRLGSGGPGWIQPALELPAF